MPSWLGGWAYRKAARSSRRRDSTNTPVKLGTRTFDGKEWKYVGRLTNKDNYGARRKFLRKEGWNYFRLINVSYDTVIYHIYARKSK